MWGNLRLKCEQESKSALGKRSTHTTHTLSLFKSLIVLVVPEIHTLSCPYHRLLSRFFPFSFFSSDVMNPFRNNRAAQLRLISISRLLFLNTEEEYWKREAQSWKWSAFSVSDRTLVIFYLMNATGSWAKPWVFICLDCVLSLTVF